MNSLSMKTLLNRLSIGCCVAACASVVSADDLYSDSFAGSGPLNGVLVEGGALQNGSVAWTANSAFNADGTINGADEGGAYLPFQPLLNSQYTLSMDVLNPTDRWVALGFARDPITNPGASDLNDRHSNEAEGIAWMLYRNNGATNAVETFTGLRTTGGQAVDSTGVNFTVANKLSIDIDTTGDGSSFTADWRINGAIVRSATIAVAVADINFVGLSFDNATTGTPMFDNFLLTGPVTVFGDVNGDGDVDGTDFGLIRDNLFVTPATRSQGDLTGDNIVDFADYREWKDNAGALASLYSLTGVPEPTALVLSVLGVGVAVLRRRV